MGRLLKQIIVGREAALPGLCVVRVGVRVESAVKLQNVEPLRQVERFVARLVGPPAVGDVGLGGPRMGELA